MDQIAATSNRYNAYNAGSPDRLLQADVPLVLKAATKQLGEKGIKTKVRAGLWIGDVGWMGGCCRQVRSLEGLMPWMDTTE